MKIEKKRRRRSPGLVIALIIMVLVLAGIIGLAAYTLFFEKQDIRQEETVSRAESAEQVTQTVSSAPAAVESSADSKEDKEKKLLEASVNDPSFWNGAPTITKEFLTVNPYSRCGKKLDAVNDIVIHYVGNAGTTAEENREYFESLKDDGSRSASAHFVVGLNGEIIQCLPTDEWSYATKWRNHDTISIEVCHPGEDGKFDDATYASVVDLTAFLCKAFQIGPDHVIRHYDVTGKICPKYYVEHEDAWKEMLSDIRLRYNMLTSSDGSKTQSTPSADGSATQAAAGTGS